MGRNEKAKTILFSVLCAVFAAGLLVPHKEPDPVYSYVENRNKAVEYVPEEEEEETAAEPELEPPEHVPELVIDSEGLLSQNPDYVGWLDIPGTSISYPVVQGKDNTEYEHVNFQGEAEYEGTLFLDAWEELDDDNLIIYGHNMAKGTMFGQLKNYRDQDWFEKYLYLDFYPVEGEPSAYKVFSVRVSSSDINSLNYEFEDIDKEEYMESAIAESDFYREPEGRGQLITLSTCFRKDKSRRLLVSGVMLE